ncbi:hypothetical protein BST81_09095 [Leptolyngbya sp. 'hensonii']|uniref:tyrosine-type recombinase/integrase n=1 Tax=Leptolyngbya sp. 'hensonii' TaxID=1922337 RepID=UPI00094FE3C1|nr:tyrosine-type recombinase/integrase [Leptolyngbya sp. 'hensonii']OLP18728.1 hypothetical protein BST81_09095 [Leptolyngbya sp. 'hensonii']
METSLPAIVVVPLSREGKPHPRSRQIQSESPDLRQVQVQEFLQRPTLAPNSRQVYAQELKRFLGWTDLTWKDLRGQHLTQYKQFLEAATSQRGKPLSTASINKAIATLKSFFKWMVATYPDLMSTNPIQRIKLEQISPAPVQGLAPEDLAQIWAALNTLEDTQQRDTVLVHLLCHGLRAGELVRLNVGDFDGRLLHLTGPQPAATRLVPLRQAAQSTVQAYLDQRCEQGETLTPDRPLLLSHGQGRQGDRLSYHGLYFAIVRLGQRAGIPDLHPHQFRHTCALELLHQGVDPMQVMYLTGYKSEKTFQRYLPHRSEAAVTAFYKAMGEGQADQ